MEKRSDKTVKPKENKLPPSRAEALERSLQSDQFDRQEEQPEGYERTYRDGSLQNECWRSR